MIFPGALFCTLLKRAEEEGSTRVCILGTPCWTELVGFGLSQEKNMLLLQKGQVCNTVTDPSLFTLKQELNDTVSWSGLVEVSNSCEFENKGA